MSEEQLQPIESTRAQKIEETCNTPEKAIRKLMMYIEELETAIYDKNKEIAERDGKIDELTEEAIRKLMMYIEELETAIYDKNKEIAERDGKIDELTEKAIRKLMMYIEELETAIYDKNKEIAERDGKIDELTEKAREYFRKFNSEQLAKRKAEDELNKVQDDILILVRQLSVTIRYRESRGR